MPAKAKKKEDIKIEVNQHYQMWTNDNDIRMTRKNGWNDITDAYYGKLPDDWPYITKIVDPRIRTSLIEKNARLINNKLRGRLVPREGNDILGAKLDNAILDFQWDTAENGGSMLTKIGICDIDTRLYQSKFGLVKWLYEENPDGTVKFDSNEFFPLDIRNCGMYSTVHVKDAKWFQVRTWEKLEDLEKQSDVSGKPLYKNLGTLRYRLTEKLSKSRKKNAYVSRVQQLRGLEDRTGEDVAFPVVELVIEYRRDRWITFAPSHDLILRDIPNPYDHGKIPIVQLRYYALQDDPLGESEVEPVIPLWKAIQATVCSYMDEVILKMRPPLKIVEGQARIETIIYGPEAQWLVSIVNAIEEMQSNGEAVRYFETTYSALISAFNVAMGDLSQGTSAVTPFEGDKTATEIRASIKQQNVRDMKNQNDLAEFIKDIMMMWLSNNKQFLLTDPDKKEFILRIVGSENFNYFKRAGLDGMELREPVMNMIADILEQKPDTSPAELDAMIEAGKTPIHPVFENPDEKDPEKREYKPKMRIADTEDSAEISIVPEDLEGEYDYTADVKSMASGASEELRDARQKAMDLILNSQSVIQLLQLEGYKPNVKELLTNVFEDLGLRDAERYFEKIEAQEVSQATAGVGQNQQPPGVPGVPQANPGAGVPQPVAGARPVGQPGQAPIPQPQGIPQGVR